MRTQSAFFADTAHTGGWVVYDAFELSPLLLAGTQTANFVITRNALGDYSLNRTAGGAETYQAVQSVIDLKRLIESPSNSPADLPFQAEFGTAAGTEGWPAGAPSLPPFTGATQLTVPTSDAPKGVQLTDVVVIYQVGVVNLTSATLTLQRTVFANNVANAITNVPISATALPLTSAGDATGPYVAVRAVTTPVFETVDLSDLTLEFQFTMANTGTMRVYALGYHCNFNFD
jgi:hypothetical protein